MFKCFCKFVFTKFLTTWVRVEIVMFDSRTVISSIFWPYFLHFLLALNTMFCLQTTSSNKSSYMVDNLNLQRLKSSSYVLNITITLCNVQHNVTNHIESQISCKRRAALPSPFTGGWLHMCTFKKCIITHILSTLFSSTSVLFSCTPFGTQVIYSHWGHRWVIVF